VIFIIKAKIDVPVQKEEFKEVQHYFFVVKPITDLERIENKQDLYLIT
jgi:hypothetical protein